ncbi:MAG: carbohydrate kinase family protein [Candidatus Woesearchaeota archaeon]
MFDIICVGSGTVDAFVETGNKLFKGRNGHCKIPFGSKILVESLKFYTGGGGTNNSVAFARMGLKTAWVGKIGKGTNSQRIIKEMKKEKVDVSMVKRSNGRTGFAVILDASGHDRTILVFKGSNNDFSLKDVSFNKLNTKWIYMGTMMGKGYKTIEKIALFAKDKGIKIAFNPSTYLAKKGKRFLKSLLIHINILIINIEEAEGISKRKKVEDMLKDLHKLGPEIVVITDGKKRAHAYDGEYHYTIKPNRIKVVEATGAGDAFGSGFVTGIIKKNDIEFAMQLGLKESQSVITHHGAKNNLLTWNDAKKIKSRKVVKRRLQ